MATVEPATNDPTGVQAEPSRDVFSVICHDLRDPLSAIVMGAQLLLSTEQDDRSRRVLEAIRRAGDRMNILIQNAATLRGQQLELRWRKQPIIELLNTACAKLERIAEGRSVRVERRFAVGDAVVHCDGARVVEVLLLVGDNAVRHAGDHPVVVEAKLTRRALTLSVTDSGGGIAKDRLATIFDWAFNASQPSREGPGLGLAAARRIVERHGGAIGVKSRVGHGTRCSIVIPLLGPRVSATADRPPEERPHARHPGR
jgi:two-component system sensor histidine kinase ResE